MRCADMDRSTDGNFDGPNEPKRACGGSRPPKERNVRRCSPPPLNHSGAYEGKHKHDRENHSDAIVGSSSDLCGRAPLPPRLVGSGNGGVEHRLYDSQRSANDEQRFDGSRYAPYEQRYDDSRSPMQPHDNGRHSLPSRERGSVGGGSKDGGGGLGFRLEVGGRSGGGGQEIDDHRGYRTYTGAAEGGGGGSGGEGDGGRGGRGDRDIGGRGDGGRGGRGDVSRGGGGDGGRGRSWERNGGGGRGGGGGGVRVMGGGGVAVGKFLLNGRTIGMDKKTGVQLAEENVDKIFNKILGQYVNEKNTDYGMTRLCQLMREGNNLKNLNAIHMSCAIDTLGKLLSKGSHGTFGDTLEDTIHRLADHFITMLRRQDFAGNTRALSSVLHGLALIHIAGVSTISRNLMLKEVLALHIFDSLHVFSPWDLSQTLWGFAKMGWFFAADKELLSKIDTACCTAFDKTTNKVRFEGVDIANILQALVLIENACGWKASDDFFQRLEKYAGTESMSLNPQGVVTTVTGLAKLDRDPHDSVKAKLCLRAIHIFVGANSQDVSNLSWGMAKMGWQPPALLFDILYRRMMATLSSFNRQEMSTMWWSTAMLNVRLAPGNEYWEGMMSRMHELVHDLNAQDTSMFFHALGLMGHQPGPILKDLLLRLPGAMDDSTPQNVTQILRALAILQTDSSMTTNALDVLSRRACVLMPSFNGQDLAGLYWSYATLKIRPDAQLMSSMANRLIEIQRDLIPQDVSLVAWAINTARWHLSDSEKEDNNDLLIDLLSSQRGPRVEYASDIHNVYDPSLVMRALTERSKAIMQNFLPRDFANILWAVTRLGEECNDFFMALCDGLEEQAPAMAQGNKGSLDPRDIAQILHALSMNRVFLDEKIGDRARFNVLLNILADMCIDLIHKFNAADMSNVLNATVNLEWSGKVQGRLMEGLLNRAVTMTPLLDGRCLTELVWAIARTGRQITCELLDIVSKRAFEILETPSSSSAGFSFLDVPTFVWALAKIQTRLSAHLRMRFATYITAHVEKFAVSHLAQILWAFSTVPPEAMSPHSSERKAEMGMCASVFKNINMRAEDLRTSDVTTMMWALVVMSQELDFDESALLFQFRQLVGVCAQRVDSVFSLMKEVEACGQDGQAPRAASPRSPRSRVEHEFDRSDMCMMHQFFLSCDIDERFAVAIGARDCLMHRVSTRYSTRCKQAFVSTSSAASDMQTRVHNVLVHHMHLQVESEFRCQRSGYSIDMQVCLNIALFPRLI